MRILIVDDNEDARIILEKTLASCGHKIETATNGEEALQMARENLPEMIISDILMPVMDGFQLCCEIKEDEELKYIPFVFYTATYTDARDEALARKMGADKFIRKPMTPDEFIKIIQSVIREIEAGKLTPKGPALEKDNGVFKLYNERLIMKLEKKMLDLEGEMAERKRVEAELRRSRREWEDIFQAIGQPAFILDPQHEIIAVNNATVSASGRSKADLLGKKCHEIFHGTDRPPEDCPLDQMRISGLFKTVEMEMLGGFHMVSCAPVFDNAGHLEKVIHIAIDVTKRVQAEAEIQRSYECQNVLNSILRTSLENISFQELLGKALDEILAVSWLPVKKKGGIFLVEDEPDVLALKVHRDLNPSLQMICAHVPFGKCLCGRAASSGRIVFSDRLDERHENHYDGISPHGHYNVPIKSGDKILGVLVLYLDEGHLRDQQEAEFLRSMSNTLAGIIERKRAEEALWEVSERRKELEYIINHSPAVVFLWRVAEGWPVEFVSENVRQFGYRPEDFYSERILFSDIIHPDDLDRVTAEINRYNQEGRENFAKEYRIITSGGEVRWLDERTWVKRDSNGDITHHQGVVLDITQRKLAEDALRRSEASLAEAQRIAHLGNWNWNIETNELFWSKEIYRIFGLSPEKFNATYEAFLGLVHPGDRELVKKSINDALYKRKPYNIEYRVVRPDGEVRVLNGRAEVTFDAAGRPIQMIGTDHDITELHQYRERLEKMVAERTKELHQSLYNTKEARDRIDAILKSIADGLIVTDIWNRVILMNRAAEDLMGVRLNEAINRPIDFAIKEKTLREKVKYTLDKKETGYEFDFELPGDDPKHPRIMRARTSVIHDKEGSQKGNVTIIRDVTHEREVDRMKTEFLSTTAHELRTPLTSIQGFSELLLTGDDFSEKEKKRFLSYINKQAVSLAGIINDLLDVARIESKRGFTLNKVKCDAGETIKHIIPHFQETASKHEFEVVLPDEPVALFIDKEKMRQALKNILSNAIKYSPEGGGNPGGWGSI